jgi:hypothetical protein
MADLWNDHDSYWRNTYNTRPYAAGRDYEYLRGGYRYGFDAANRYKGRSWDEVESDLSRDWNTYEHRGQSTWENVKDAVRDAWNRLTGDTEHTTVRSGSTRSNY